MPSRRLVLAAAIAVATLAFACNALIGISDVPPAGDGNEGGTPTAEGGGEGGDEASPLADAGKAMDSGDAMTTAAADSASDATGDTRESGAPEAGCTDPQCDTHNCGAPNHDCQGGSCVQGHCQPYALVGPSAGVPAKLAQDGTYLYWTDTTNGAVNRSDKKTGETHPVTQMTTIPFPIVYDDAGGGVVFWGDATGVHYCPATGCVGTGAPPTVATASLAINGLAVDSTSVYWSIGQPEVRTASKYGSPKAGTAIWEGDASVAQILTDGRQVYFTADDGVLHVVGVDGGGATTASWGAPASAPTMGLALFGAAVYWTVADPSNGQVYSASVTAPSTSVSSLTYGQPAPVFLATDGTTIYWADLPSAETGSIVACSIAGCVPTPLAQQNSYSPEALLVDDVAIYWSDNGSNATIWKLAK